MWLCQNNGKICGENVVCRNNVKYVRRMWCVGIM